MSDVTQGFSQFLYTYGPGAMVDLPENAVVVAGLNDWDVSGAASQVIEEPRLTELLRQLDEDRLPVGTVPVLRTPPLHDDDRKDDWRPSVDVRIFPEWFVCDAAPGATAPDGPGETRRRLAPWKSLKVMASGQLRHQGDDGKALKVNPIRFVSACGKGHLADIDWRQVVHRGRDGACQRPMSWVEHGVSSDPIDISVRCDCGALVSLASLHIAGYLGDCGAFSPWLTPRKLDGEGCGEPLRLLARSATNAYFPQTER